MQEKPFVIENIIDNEKWIEFLKKTNYNTFLHSLGWEEFCKKQGYKTWKLALWREGKIQSVALLLKVKARRGTFLQCSHGPQSIKPSKEIFKIWTKHFKKLAKQEKCDFIRIAPIYTREKELDKIYTQNGWKNAPIHIHAEQTVVIDLTKTEKEILMAMRKTTRQMCKKGEKLLKNKEIEVEWVDEITEEMFHIYDSTTRRGQFIPFSRTYLINEYQTFKENEKAKLIVVKHKDKILSWGMFVYANNRVFYHQGANLLDKKIPAAYIMHWEGIKKAKQEGAISYDFWGVSPEGAKKHPWKNISLFKRGFGGEYKELIKAKDCPITAKYWFTWIIETIRRKKRGF